MLDEGRIVIIIIIHRIQQPPSSSQKSFHMPCKCEQTSVLCRLNHEPAGTRMCLQPCCCADACNMGNEKEYGVSTRWRRVAFSASNSLHHPFIILISATIVQLNDPARSTSISHPVQVSHDHFHHHLHHRHHHQFSRRSQRKIQEFVQRRQH